ncbi:hypothetical protein KQI52_04800 [bacterium]|nr:hypothetical protein [bacterium]
MNRLTNRITLMLFILLIALLAGCRQTFDSAKQLTAIEIDGDIRDWDVYPRHTFDEYKTSVSLVNNDTMLYVLVLRKNLDMYVAQGVNFWIQTKSNRDDLLNIRYYGKAPNSVVIDPRDVIHVSTYERAYDLEDNKSRAELGGIWDMILYQSLRENRPSLVSSSGSDGPRAVQRMLPGNVRAYEFAFPLKNHRMKAYALPLLPGESFKFGFEFISRYAMVWGTTMWQYRGTELVRTYYMTNTPTTADVHVQHDPLWVTVTLHQDEISYRESLAGQLAHLSPEN